MDDMPRNRMARLRPLVLYDFCEICTRHLMVLQCRVSDWQITLCADCSKEQRRLLDVWDELQGDGDAD